MCVLQPRLHAISLPRSLAPSLAPLHTHTVQLRRRRRWRRQRDSLLFSLRQKDLRPPCFCLDESATQRAPEAGSGTAGGSSKGKSQHSPSKQFLAGNNRLLSPLRAHLQCAANFTQSRAERGEGEGEEGGKKRLLPAVPGRGAGAGPSRARLAPTGLSPLAAGGGVGGGRGGGKVDLESGDEFFNWTKPNALSSRGEKTTTEGGTGGMWTFGKLSESPGPRCFQGQEVAPDGTAGAGGGSRNP